MTDFNALVDEVAAPEQTAPEPTNDNAPPSRAPNRFADLVDQVASDHQAQAEALNASLQGTDADKLARATDLGKQFGLPPQAVMPNLGEFAARSELMKDNKVLQDNPQLMSWVSNSPDIAGVAKGDYDNLGFLSRTVNAVKQGFVRGAEGSQFARLQYNELAGTITPAETILSQKIAADLEKPEDNQGFYRVVNGLSGFVGGMVEQFSKMGPEIAAGTATGAAVGSVAGGVGAAPGAVAGAGAGTVAGFVVEGYKTGAGQIYNQLKQMRDANGNPLDPAVVRNVSIGGGIMLGLLNALNLQAINKPFAAAASRFIPHLSSELIARPTVAAAVGNFVKGMAQSGLTGAAYGALGQLTQEAATTAAQKFSPGEWQTALDNPEQFKAAAARVGDAAEQMAINLGALHLLPGALTMGTDIMRARASQGDQTYFNNLMQGAQQSATRQRSPDAFQSFLSSQTEGSPVENVYVPAAKVMELYQSQHIVPSENDALLGKAIPDIADQLAQAVPRGADVVIPTANYATHLAGTPADSFLRPDLRVRQDGMSFNEARDYQANFKNIVAGVSQDFENSQQAQEPARLIYQDMQQKAEQAGFTTKQATQYAALTASRYMTRANRLGVDPLDLYQEQGIDLQRQESPALAAASGESGRALSQTSPTVKPAFQEPSRNISERTPPEGIFTTRAIKPSTAEGGTSSEASDISEGYHGPRDLQTLKTLAEKASPDFSSLLETIAKNVSGAELDGIRVKDEQSLTSKIARGYDPHEIGDYLGGRIMVDSHEAADQVIAQLQKYADVLHVDDFMNDEGRPSGYRAIHVQIMGKDGLSAEVQIQTTEMREAQSEVHPLYKKWQTEVTPEQMPEALADQVKTRQIFDQAWRDFTERQKQLEDSQQRAVFWQSFPADRKQEAVAFKALMDSSGLDAKDFSDVIKSAASLSESDSSGGIPSLTPMLTLMRSVISEKPQILDSIIKFVPVDVVNNLFGSEAAAKEALHNETMLKDSSAFNADLPVTSNGDTSDPVGLLVRQIAIMTAKRLTGALSAGGEADKGNAAAITNEGMSSYQGGPPRAKITLEQGRNIITLFEKGDKTSILHEMGHLWLEELRTDALRTDAPEQLKNDWATVQKAIGHEGEGAISTESHETFARSFEQYLMEGKAPSNALLGAFRRFKLWLTNIYRSVGGLGVDLNDDTRKVFDRMLATDDEISQVEQRQQVNRLFKTAQEAGMTDREFAAYNATAMNAEASAREQLLTEALGDIKKRDTRAWRAADDEMRPDVEKTVNNQQDMRMLDYFRTGKMRDENGIETEIPAMKIDRDALQALYGGGEAGIEKLLPSAIRKAISAKDGLDPDEIAPFLGYQSGKAMIDDMLALGKTEQTLRANGSRQPVNDFIADQEVNRQLQAKFGLSEDAMRQRAEEIVNGATRMDLKLAELRALGRKTGQPVTFTRDNIKQWAQDQIAGMRAKDAANVFSFVRAMGKAGRDTERAVAKGDDAGAFQALQRQALNMAMANEAREAENIYNRALTTFKNLASKAVIKSADQEYLDQVHGILRQYGFSVNRNDTELNNALAGKNFQDFVMAKRGNGRDVEVPDFMFGQVQPQFKDLTYSQLSGLKDAVDSLMHNARDEQKITVNGVKMARDQVINEILKNVDEFPKKQKRPFLNPEDAGKLRYGLDRFTSTLRGADAELLKPEQFLDWLDQRDTLGPLNETVFRPLKEAQIREMDLLKEKAQSFAEMDMPKEWNKALTHEVPNDTLIDPDTGEPARMSRKTMLTVALNVGNASNLKKLSEGYGWDARAVMDFLHANMTKPDWDFVQHSWDSFESLWPQVEDLQRRTTGIAPEKIVPTPINTPFGQYDGGYYPVVYDPRTTVTGKRAMNIDSIFDNDYFRPATSKGHTISRLENFTDRLSLNLDILPWKLRQTIHDLSFREAIVNADKILSDTRFQKALEDTWGPEYGKEFRPWLKDIANQPNADNRPMSFIDNALRYSRMTMVEVGIGFRLTTMLKHGLTAFVNSVGELGPDWMRRGVTEYYSDHDGMKDFVFERSGEMRNRMGQYDRDIRENMATLLGEDSVVQQMRRYGHYGVAYLDMESAVPTWLGAYRKALSEGKEEDDAIYYADKTVRNAHGAQGLVDMAGVQRGPEYKKLFTMFYGFFNHMYNRQRDIVRRAQEMQTPLDLAKVLGKTVAYVAVPAMVEQAISGSQKPDDESWGAYAGKAIAGQLAATLPLVRDVAGYLEYGRGLETPLSRMIQAFGNQAKDIGKWLEGQEASKKWLRHAIETPGYIFAAPTGQAAVAAQFLWDVSNGKEDPESLKEWMHGLMYGTAKPKQ